MVGSLLIVGGTKTAYASGEPIAGITVVLENISIETENILNPIIEYRDLAIANVTNYVNIRSEANTNSKVVGKLYHNGAATILGTKGEWINVKSGNVTGYIKSDYLLTGNEVYEIAEEVKAELATVKVNALNVRAKADISSSVVTMIPKGDVLEIIEEDSEWTKISLGDKTGYVSTAYVDIKTDFKEAISIQEEKRKELAKKQSSSTSSIRQSIVNYALRFKGNPYVWGGTSLTRGADCSGFTQSVLKNYGISIPRTSRSQANGGKRVSMDKIQPGDLIFYRKNGRVNHVAMYIGNGKVVGAASRREGINIKDYNYRTPYKAVSYINR
jgi:cell wall-associated NlpC family hydrolase